MSMIASDDLLTRQGDPFSCALGDEVILLNAHTGMYYALDATAARIWTLLERPIRFGDLCDTLTTEFAVSAERCRADVSACLRPLIDDALILASAPAP